MQPIDIINGLIGVHDERLTALQKRVQILMDFHAETINGGWDQYLFNSSGDGANALWNIANQCGYDGIASALELISQRMGGAIPNDRAQRERRLEELRASLSESDQITALLQPELTRIWDDTNRLVEDNLNELSEAHAALREPR